MIKAAIDSFPVCNDLLNSSDYSGIQLYSQVETTLKDLIDQNKLTVTNNGNLVIDINELYWASGNPVQSIHYVIGMLQFIQKNHWYKIVFSNYFSGIDCRPGQIIFNVIKGFGHEILLDLLKVPNFAPVDNQNVLNKFSGDYTLLYDPSNLKWILNEHPYNRSSHLTKEIHILVCKSSTGNIRKFHTKELDITADTAFPANLISRYSKRQEYFKTNTGLFCFLQFSKTFISRYSADLLISIKNILKEQLLDNLETKLWTRVSTFAGDLFQDSNNILDYSTYTSSRLSDIILILGYDDFYPNKHICIKIKQILEEQLGIICKLKINNFHNPAFNVDMFFSINYFKANNKTIRYAMLGLLSQNPEQYRKKLFTTIESKFDSKLIQDLDDEIDDSPYLIPLFSVNSHYLSRYDNNFMLKAFQ